MAPMREPAVVEAIAIEPAIAIGKIPFSRENPDVTMDDQAGLYTLAIIDAFQEFEDEQQLGPKSIYLVNTIVDTVDGESYTFSIPTTLQLAISANLESLPHNPQWVSNLEEVFDNPKLPTNQNDYVISMGDLKLNEDDSISVFITIHINGVEESRFEYTLKNLDNEWKIDSVERVINASQNQ